MGDTVRFMKKAVKWALVALNMLLVGFLVLLSGVMLYFSLAHPAELFGHTALLLDESGEEPGGGESLYILEAHPRALGEGDVILCTSEGQGSVLRSVVMNGEVPCYLGPEGEPVAIDTSLSTFSGRVVWQDRSLGGLLARASEQPVLSYGMIGAGLLLCLVILTGVLWLARRSGMLEEEDAPADPFPREEKTPVPVAGDLGQVPHLTTWQPWRPSQQKHSAPPERAFPDGMPPPPVPTEAEPEPERFASDEVKIYHPHTHTPEPLPPAGQQASGDDLEDWFSEPLQPVVPPFLAEKKPAPSSSDHDPVVDAVLADIERQFEEELK